MTSRHLPQAEQAEEAKGKTDTGDNASTAAQGHGAARAERGFTVGEMVAEFQLRATVIRLWTEQEGEIAKADLDDTAKFHEGSIRRSPNRSRVTPTSSTGRRIAFLAILGHDLRNSVERHLDVRQLDARNRRPSRTDHQRHQYDRAERRANESNGR